MPTPLEYAVARRLLESNNSTGPRTPEGKARSSENSFKHGLFAVNPRIAPEDRQLRADLATSLIHCLQPVDALERTFADEIIRASWRLNRCAKLEETNDERATEIAIDRARANALNIVLKATAELRRLQTNRRIGLEIYPEGTDFSESGLATHKEVLSALAANNRMILSQKEKPDTSSFCKTPEAPAKAPEIQTETAPHAAPKTTQTARNAQCPCHSGEKFKRCCGKNAPPVLCTPQNEPRKAA